MNYLKNFLIKLLILPLAALLGAFFLLLFLFAPQFKLLKDVEPSKHWRSKTIKKDGTYEPFY